MTKNLLNHVILSLAAVAALTIGPEVARAEVAMVVNRNSPIDNIEAKALRKMFLGRTSTCANGSPILLGESTQLSTEVYRHLLDMSPLEFRRVWIKVVFAGGRATPPEPLDSAAAVIEFVGRSECSIAFMDSADLDQSVKIVAIDGILPGSDGYLFARLTTGAY